MIGDMSLADAYNDFSDAVEAGPVVLAKFLNLSVTRTHLIYKGESYPIAGLSVTVDAAGSVSRRPTLTRWLIGGPFSLAFQKRLDNRELYLTFEGPTFGFVVPVHPDIAYGARQFAAKVNAASRSTEGGSSTGTAGVTARQ